MGNTYSLNQRRIAANIDRIGERQRGKVLSSPEVICRPATASDLAAFDGDAVRPMDRLLAQPIRCRDGRAS